ncbi:MAG: AtpZ/AtpI family protein [Pyrinomonadaceae bacterium]
MTGLGLKDDEEQRKTDAWPDEKPSQEPDFVPLAYAPPTEAESVRRSGLAYSAGIMFFGSVVFMLFLGWGADLLFGSAPWGLVGGIVLGAIIGFLQFFRITSQIFTTKKDGPAVRPLMPSDDDQNS